MKGKGREARLSTHFNERGERILKALDEVAKETGATQASIAVAWLMAQPTITAPISSATSLEQLESLFAAAELRLNQAAMDNLNQAGAY